MRDHAKSGPYVGIAGITSHRQVVDILSVAPSCDQRAADCGHPGRRVAIGVLVSDKTLAGEPVKRPKRSPNVSGIPDIWHPDVFNTLHYHTIRKDADLVRVSQICGQVIGHGMQLNIAWPEPSRVSDLGSTGIVPILQVSPSSWSECDGSVDEVIRRIDLYGPSLGYVLMDMSAGKGVPMSVQDCEHIRKVFHQCPGVGLVVAGGFGPGSGYMLESLSNGHHAATAMRFCLGVDAESGLRDVDDELDVEKCRLYLGEMLDLLEGPTTRHPW